MAFPAGLTLVTVHGEFDMPPGGGAAGRIEFTARYPLVGPDDDSIVPPFTIGADLDEDGEFTVELPATNDPQWTPTGWAYAVRGHAGGGRVGGTLQLDYLTTSVELADLIQVDGTAEQGHTYIPLSQRSIAGGVAGLDVDGDVIDASGSKVTGGGGGGGPSPSSTVVSATSYGTSAAAGSASAYSRGDHTHGSHAAPASTDISDATTTGKAVLTAASAAAARTAISAETSGAAATALATAEAYADSAVATHSADTTAVHGITDTSALVVTTDTRLTNARTPTAHASTHASAGSDPVSLNASQITAGTLATTQGGTGLGSFTSGNFVSASSTSALATTKAVPTGVVVGTTDTQTLTNKTLTAPAISSPTGLAKADVGLSAVTNAAQVPLSTVTTKGDLLVATASATVARQAVGSDGQVLAADSSQTNGVKYVAHVPAILLSAAGSVPGGTPANTLVFRTAT